VILGKQWRAEPEEVKLHFKKLAEELKKKHAEEHPDYQYTPRKPSEKKRRGISCPSSTSRQSIPLKSPLSMTTSSPNALTTPLCTNVQNSQATDPRYLDPLDSLNVMFEAGDLIGDHTKFGTSAFDTLFQHVQGDYSRTSLFPQLDIPEQSFGDSFDFPEFRADCF
jgi:hypothetical protein